MNVYSTPSKPAHSVKRFLRGKTATQASCNT